MFFSKLCIDHLYKPNPQWEQFYDVSKFPRRGWAEAAQGLLHQAHDAQKLVNTTLTPRVFFERYDFLIGRMRILSQMEHILKFSGELPSTTVRKLKNPEKRTAVVDEFWNRYTSAVIQRLNSLKTVSAKQRCKDRFLVTAQNYAAYMSPNSIEHLNSLSEKVLEI